MVTQTERGYTRNPASLIKNAAMGMIAKFAGEFGLTPSSRSKLVVAKKPEDNPFAALMAE
jgi:P27 family predicted phage terminase small subunit